MAEAALQMQPEHFEVEERAVTLPEKATSIRIVDQATFAQAGEFLLGVKALRREIDETFDPLVRKAHEAHKAAVAAKKKVEGPVAEAETIVKRGMGAYQQEQDRIRREAEEGARRERERLEREARAREEEERKRLEAEAEDRRLAEALEAEQRGDVTRATQILEAPPAPVFVPPAPAAFVPPPAPEPAKVEGVSFMERWEFEVVDPRLVPREYLAVDEKKIGGVVRSLKGEAKIPGVRIWSTKTVAARAR
jgi:hypothetical protein